MAITLLIILGYILPLVVSMWVLTPWMDMVGPSVLIPVYNWILMVMCLFEIYEYFKENYKLTWEDE
jgi:hypothetical protein